MSERLADLCDELHKLADLMADSLELRVEETPIVARLNELIEQYDPSFGECKHRVKDGEFCVWCNRFIRARAKAT